MEEADIEHDVVVRHAERLRNWLEWKRKSDSLRRGALVLHQQAVKDWEELKQYFGSGKTVDVGEAGIELGSQIAMMNGLALETLVKAISVRRKDPIGKNGKLAFGHHRTRDLLDELGIPITDDEEELLLRLENYVYWAGKYPSPSDARYLLPQPLKSGQTTYPAYTIFIRDEESFTALYSRLVGVLREG